MPGPGPTTLVIDSATDACSVALFAGDECLGGEYRLLGRGHAEALVPMIAALPGKGRADRIVVALGPGSFTGVRVGLAAARALALAWGSSLAGYPTLALIAAMAQAAEGTEPLTVVNTGGHGEWFVESFDAEGASTAPLASLRPEAAATTANEALVAGSQAERLVALRGFGRAVPLLPDARAFALLPASALSERIDPLYGRAPDAKIPGVRIGTQAA
ncbi:tRNA (adenosine(37)-N6)-threonylcarbamoyltransferase complex dimerization subunit type 1 TsaB [Novosphingobium resinovorum]|uniref:tRNA (adenosine(37)-N6)-threonylcarbamoyltransferase complex dimerization subunit type 1 TsaB n=1 Tax=Novosphingobium resinovorum TaxID=158500 RepID=UPI002ED47949|nr:tRNA (adenosine(37)-N6)-threonylcarbamoyltransferase complex dimerization subunit type 1 TsaB [Novosphingobium resinovorum]